MVQQPQATYTPAVGTTATDIPGMVTNERMITSAPQEDQGIGDREDKNLENLSDATSISRLSVDDPLHIDEMEYTEAQRWQQKVSTKLDNLYQNWGVEKTLVPLDEQALVDEGYQWQIAKYKFIVNRLNGICKLCE